MHSKASVAELRSSAGAYSAAYSTRSTTATWPSPSRRRRARARGRAVHPGRPAGPPRPAAGERRGPARAWSQLATADNPRFLVSPIEIEARPALLLGRHHGGSARPSIRSDDFVLIMSAEAAAALPSWRDPMRLIELAEIAVVPRLGYDEISRDWLDDVFPGPRTTASTSWRPRTWATPRPTSVSASPKGDRSDISCRRPLRRTSRRMTCTRTKERTRPHDR